MKYFFKIFFKSIRFIIGPMILFIDKITTPRGIKRPIEEQSKIDQAASSMVLYQFKTCPFCIKVKRNNKRLSLKIETRDAQHNSAYREELLQGGGQIKVPCLKIIDDRGNDSWMYESNDIMQYLQERFAA
ncbi:MAG: glutaredoxin [Woeseiaceae bacterium]